MKKSTDYSILLIGAIILIAVIASSCGNKKAYYYNAYSPGYDELFVLKSFTPLRNDTVVHFDDNSVACSYKTGFQAKILAPYLGKIGHY